MAIPVQLVEPSTGRVAIGYKGISWTCLFFGPIPALVRGHILGFIVMLVGLFVTFGASWVLSIFFYNRWHFAWLLKKGFRANGMSGGNLTSQNVINVSVGNVSGHAANSAPQSSAGNAVL